VGYYTIGVGPKAVVQYWKKDVRRAIGTKQVPYNAKDVLGYKSMAENLRMSEKTLI
jgi:hypothetical protein